MCINEVTRKNLKLYFDYIGETQTKGSLSSKGDGSNQGQRQQMALYSLNHGHISSKWYALGLVWVILAFQPRVKAENRDS